MLSAGLLWSQCELLMLHLHLTDSCWLHPPRTALSRPTIPRLIWRFTDHSRVGPDSPRSDPAGSDPRFCCSRFFFIRFSSLDESDQNRDVKHGPGEDRSPDPFFSFPFFMFSFQFDVVTSLCLCSGPG